MNAREKEVDEKEFEDELNELFGEVNICGLTYSAGYALREIDPTAFRCAMADKDIVWVCDECDSEYDSQEEAEECCKPEPEEETETN